jgi:quercetin dioxygenase-like cupin family protein
VKAEELIASGIIESYCLGIATPEEIVTVATLAQRHPGVQAQVHAVQQAIESYASAHGIIPPAGVKEKIMSRLGANDVLKSINNFAPAVTLITGISDHTQWERIDAIAPPASYENIHFHPLYEEEGMLTAMVWATTEIPEEVHEAEVERFLILEGECECIVDGQKKRMRAGDFMEIRPHEIHSIRVISDKPVKALFQRKAA